VSITSFRGKYFFLSNFATSIVHRTRTDVFPYDVHTYVSVEHAFQASKAKSHAAHLWVSEAYSCAEAKRRGSAITLREDWENVKLAIMKECVLSKFSLNRDLRDSLLETGDEQLIEGNSWGDRYWGVSNADDQGQNHLGRILMEVRNELRH
jgi:ribA/ribD-fused uncharacterized protein